MSVRTMIAQGFAVAGAAALAVGVYGMQTLGECTIDGCPMPMSVTIPAFAGGMLVAILATIAGAGGLGFALTFLAPGLGSIVAISTGHGTVVGYVFAVVFTLIGLLALIAVVAGSRNAEVAARLRATGADGTATVLSVQDTGVSVNDNPRVRLELRVVPVDESAPFDRSTTLVVSRVSIPRPGDLYRVKYDRADRSRVLLGEPLPPPGVPTPGGMPHLKARASDVPAAAAPSAPPPPWGTPPTAGAAPSTGPGADTVVDQLTKLDALRRSGALTEEEFQQQKARLLAQ